MLQLYLSVDQGHGHLLAAVEAEGVDLGPHEDPRGGAGGPAPSHRVHTCIYVVKS